MLFLTSCCHASGGGGVVQTCWAVDHKGKGDHVLTGIMSCHIVLCHVMSCIMFSRPPTSTSSARWGLTTSLWTRRWLELFSRIVSYVLTVVNFQTCKFQVGSYSYDMAKMIFTQSNKVSGYVKTAHSVVLDYAVCQIFFVCQILFVIKYFFLQNIFVCKIFLCIF